MRPHLECLSLQVSAESITDRSASLNSTVQNQLIDRPSLFELTVRTLASISIRLNLVHEFNIICTTKFHHFKLVLLVDTKDISDSP
jgi:hypothetical protein